MIPSLFFTILGGDKKSYPTIVAGRHLCLSPVMFPDITAMSPTPPSEFFVLLLAFSNASNNEGQRNEQERARPLIGTSKKSTRFQSD